MVLIRVDKDHLFVHCIHKKEAIHGCQDISGMMTTASDSSTPNLVEYTPLPSSANVFSPTFYSKLLNLIIKGL